MDEKSVSPLPCENNFLYQKKIVFTGTLQTMTREKAHHLVTILNGEVHHAVKKSQIFLLSAFTTKLFLR
ncbi:hypothetical protein [Enterococcus sp. DIV0788_1]|uniref:hypothetical protein n=1 Tax=Enterococcus sp. DIV0788_1 TaxID=2774645 RepID=UPI003F68237F